MASYNKIIIIGNLGRDPEIREFSGRKVANFSVAVNDSYTKSNGEKVENTEWFRVSFWGNTAEVAEKYLKQGSQVYIEGRLKTQEYKDREGNTRTALEVSGQNLTMLGSGGMESNPTDSYPSQNNQSASESPSSSETTSTASSEPEEELPF